MKKRRWLNQSFDGPQSPRTLEIDEQGLDEMDKRILRTIKKTHRGGPVGMSTIGVAVGEEMNTLKRFTSPTRPDFCNGRPCRKITPKGYGAIGVAVPVGPQQGDFFRNSQFTPCNPANRASESFP